MNKRDYLLEQLRKGWSPLDVRDAILEAPISGNMKMVLTAIVSHRNNDGKARVGVRRLAQLAGVNKDTAAACATKLVKLGLAQRTEPARKDDPPTYDLDCLPTRLITLLSVSESSGHHVSESKGHDNKTPCPNPVDRGVRNEPPVVSEKGGPVVSETEGQKQGELKQEEISRKSRKTRARGATPPKRPPSGVFYLPQNWQPTPEQLAYATENRVELPALLEKFKADCAGGRKPSKNSATVSFDGIFWTYLRNDVKWAAERATKGFATRKTAAPQRGMAEGIAADESGFDDSPPPAKRNGQVIPMRAGEATR